MRFTGLLYKVADQAKYRKCPNGRQQSTESRQSHEGHCQASPIDLKNDDDSGITGVLGSPTPNLSVYSGRAPSHISATEAPTSSVVTNDKEPVSARARAPFALPAYCSPAVGPNLREPAYGKRKLTRKIVSPSRCHPFSRLLRHGRAVATSWAFGGSGKRPDDNHSSPTERAAERHHARRASRAGSGPQTAEAGAPRDPSRQVPSHFRRCERRTGPPPPHRRGACG